MIRGNCRYKYCASDPVTRTRCCVNDKYRSVHCRKEGFGVIWSIISALTASSVTDTHKHWAPNCYVGTHCSSTAALIRYDWSNNQCSSLITLFVLLVYVIKMRATLGSCSIHYYSHPFSAVPNSGICIYINLSWSHVEAKGKVLKCFTCKYWINF